MFCVMVTLRSAFWSKHRIAPFAERPAQPVKHWWSSRSGIATWEFVSPPLLWPLQHVRGTSEACPVLAGLIGLTLVIYFLQHGNVGQGILYKVLVFYPPTLTSCELWRVLTHIVLHADGGHLLSNLLHLLNMLDIEAAPSFSGYPAHYALGSRHVAGVAATASAFGCLVGSVKHFGAMFEGCSALCFGLDGAFVCICCLLLGGGPAMASEPFLFARLQYIALHVLLECLRVCCGPPGTIGILPHAAGFLSGFCYIILVMPDLGDSPAPTVNCWHVGNFDRRPDACVALFSRDYEVPLINAQILAAGILAVGVAAAFWNAYLRRSECQGDECYFVLPKLWAR